MTVQSELSLKSTSLQKALFGLKKAMASPRSTLSWVLRGHMAKDRVFVSHTYWFTGMLPRVPLARVLAGIETVEVQLPRAFDRNTGPKTGASITVEEACHLGAIARCIEARKALEIGTYDGNTALLLAANMAADG